MSEEQTTEPEAVEAPAETQESPQDSGLAAFAAMEAARGLGLEDDDEYAAKESDEADAPEDEASDAGDPVSETAEAVEEAGSATPAEREAAIRALRRAKTPQSVIDGLGDDDLLKWGTDLAKIQSDVDKKLSAPEASEPDEDGDAEQPEPTQQAPAPADAYGDMDWEAISAPLKDTFGDRDAEAVTGSIKLVFDRLSQRNQVLVNAVEELMLQNQFQRLQGNYPQLADPEQVQVVRDKAKSLNAREYQSLDDLIGDAARLAFGAPRDAAQEKRSSVSRKRSASQTRTQNRKVPVAELSDFERGFDAFKDLEDKYGLG